MDIVTYALSKKASNDYTDSKVEAFVSGVTYKGSVSSVEDLPASASKGDTYNIPDFGYYTWDGSEWSPASRTVSLARISDAQIDALFEQEEQ